MKAKANKKANLNYVEVDSDLEEPSSIAEIQQEDESDFHSNQANRHLEIMGNTGDLHQIIQMTELTNDGTTTNRTHQVMHTDASNVTNQTDVSVDD